MLLLSRSILFLMIMALSFEMVSSFLLQPKTTRRLSSAAMVGGGGKGWDNANYLDNLGSDEQGRQDATKKYQEFSESRASFMERQQKYVEQMSQTEKGRKLLEQYQQQQKQQAMGMDEDASLQDEDEIVVGSGGGTRMAAVMAKARQKQQGGKRGTFPGGRQQFEQKLAIPLDDEEEEESNE